MARFKTATGMHFGRRLILAGMALLASGSTSIAHSDTMEEVLTRMTGTLEVHMEPYMKSGQLKGCDLLYTAIAQDWTYRQGGFIKVTGNVGFIKANGSIGSTLKVVVFDIETSKPNVQFIPSPPSRAYLIGEKTSSPSNDPSSEVLQFEERRLVTENDILLKRILEAETEGRSAEVSQCSPCRRT
ncbi:MAG: hypothetical protein AAAB35_04710 [Phyllobacterium sp.]|uniref:hypothetical protein n=1 Tax=Phyllobacterium sp. TaxID=1871046 RepID=UPI0030F125FC